MIGNIDKKQLFFLLLYIKNTLTHVMITHMVFIPTLLAIERNNLFSQF